MVLSTPIYAVSRLHLPYSKTVAPVTYLRECDTFTASKERPSTLQQRFDLFPHSLDQCCAQPLFLLSLRLQDLIHRTVDFPNECIREECDPGPRQRTRRTFPGRRPEARIGKQIGDEGADDSGLGDDLVFQDAIGDFYAWDEASWVHLEVPRLARTVERDDDFFVWDFEGAKGDVCAVSPGATVIGIQSY